MGNVEKFYDALTKDESLRGRANGINEKFKRKQPSEAEVIDNLIVFADSAGYSFTAEEYRAFAENPKKMSEDDLKAVAGGDIKFSECFCIIGGAGYDRERKEKCYCVAVGVSSTEDRDTLTCIAIGITD
jgi:hypothetical protein